MVDSVILHLNNFINTWKGWGDVASGIAGVFGIASDLWLKFEAINWIFCTKHPGCSVLLLQVIQDT